MVRSNLFPGKEKRKRPAKAVSKGVPTDSKTNPNRDPLPPRVEAYTRALALRCLEMQSRPGSDVGVAVLLAQAFETNISEEQRSGVAFFHACFFADSSFSSIIYCKCLIVCTLLFGVLLVVRDSGGCTWRICGIPLMCFRPDRPAWWVAAALVLVFVVVWLLIAASFGSRPVFFHTAVPIHSSVVPHTLTIIGSISPP